MQQWYQCGTCAPTKALRRLWRDAWMEKLYCFDCAVSHSRDVLPKRDAKESTVRYADRIMKYKTGDIGLFLNPAVPQRQWEDSVRIQGQYWSYESHCGCPDCVWWRLLPFGTIATHTFDKEATPGLRTDLIRQKIFKNNNTSMPLAVRAGSGGIKEYISKPKLISLVPPPYRKALPYRGSAGSLGPPPS